MILRIKAESEPERCPACQGTYWWALLKDSDDRAIMHSEPICGAFYDHQYPTFDDSAPEVPSLWNLCDNEYELKPRQQN